LYRTKSEFYLDEDTYATVRTNMTNGERCLLADRVFRTWSVVRIQKNLIGKRIVVLHAFIKKSQQTPDNELKMARKRLKEVMHG